MAVAIALDATVIRLVVVPASMRLTGSWNWWMPLLPRRRQRPAGLPPVMPADVATPAPQLQR
jgi:RND superfamily putative drug exporter